jgi:IS30 family transposase
MSSANGGIAPRARTRSAYHLSLSDRELIERSLARGESIRAVARWIGSAPSTISREIARHGGRSGYDAADDRSGLRW